MDPTAELLSQLNDIESPAATGLWIAPGWLLVALVLLALTVFLIRTLRKTLAARAADWRPAARRELDVIKNSVGKEAHTTILADCSRFARRITLAVAPRGEVAALSGDAWLQKLDDITGTDDFTQGVGSILATGPYQRPTDNDGAQVQDLVEALERLVTAASKPSALTKRSPAA